MKKQKQIVGSVSIYGTSQVGYGYLAFTKGQGSRAIGGDGEPKGWRNATSAIWRGLEDIKDSMKDGLVEVHYDFHSGPRMTTIDLSKRWPYFGEIEWREGIIYTISAEELKSWEG